MTNAWSGANPAQITDPASYSLGSALVVNVDIQVIGLRVFSGASPGSLAGRNGRLWTGTGAQLALVAMPSTLPAGWAEYDFSSPVTVLAGSTIIIAFDSGGNYCILNNAFNSAVPSADGAVTFLAAASAPHGNGSFTTSVGTYPTTGSGNNTFYGVDLVYQLATAPVITSMSVTGSGLTATASITATDAVGGSLVSPTYRWDWGDGHIDSGSSSTASHTYASAGLEAVLGTVIASGQSASAARPVNLFTPPSAGGILPDVERVAVAWLSSLASLTAQNLVGGVATTLPPTDASGSTWNSLPVFAMVNSLPGITNRTFQMRANMVRVDLFAGRGKLMQVGSVAEAIQEATYTMEGCGVLTPAANNLPVNLRDVSVFQTPRQVRGDLEAFARVTMILVLTYTITPQGG